jgi:hypothetical protein
MTQTANGNADTVVQVQYEVTATDGTHTAEIKQAATLQPRTDGAFIPFADLTEAQVIAWVKASLQPNQEQRFEEVLTQVLQRKANPPVRPNAKAAPWNTCSQA